ncbi:MAG TPA: thioesterase family protein [Casimicrobiaceae bacterium]|nr:thioesterase family protein [Casimicrobiaceae bacterium]
MDSAKDRLLVHTSHQSMRWADMDAIGHVNNTTYFRYMEQARIEWFYSLSREVTGGAPVGGGTVIVNASCTFIEPLIYPGDLEVRMYLGEPGRTSLGSFYEIHKDGRLHAEGAARIVWIDLANGRPTPLPDSIVAPLRAKIAVSEQSL